MDLEQWGPGGQIHEETVLRKRVLISSSLVKVNHHSLPHLRLRPCPVSAVAGGVQLEAVSKLLVMVHMSTRWGEHPSLPTRQSQGSLQAFDGASNHCCQCICACTYVYMSYTQIYVHIYIYTHV